MPGGILTGRRLSSPLGAALLTAAVFGSGLFCLASSQLSADIVTIWFANAVPLAVMLVRPPREWGVALAAAAIGTFAAYAVIGSSGAVALGYALCAVTEIAIAASLLTASRAEDMLGSWRSVLLFLGFGVSASTALGSLGAGIVSSGFQLPDLGAWHTRWLSHAIGMLTFTPVMLALLRRDRQSQLSLLGAIEFSMIVAALLVSSSVGFSSLLNHTSVGYVALIAVLPCIVWAAGRFGSGGAAFGNLLVTVAAAGAAAMAGPGSWGQ